MDSLEDINLEDEILAQVRAVAMAGGEMEIVGGASKRFYGEPIEAVPVEVDGHSGVIDYDPAELVITVRAGSRLHQVEQLLADNGQMFAFEPSCFNQQATIGGMIATGLAGPRRAYSGGVRDFVLGVKLINGNAEIQNFGGKVIKNVAGFDISRLMVGALGTLGVILEVSLKVVPVPACEVSLGFDHSDVDSHLQWINQLGTKPHPATASCWENGQSVLRLSGSEQGVAEAKSLIGGTQVDFDWAALTEQRAAFFQTKETITRLSLPPMTADFVSSQTQLIEWSGAQRWVKGEIDIEQLREQAGELGGSAAAYRNHAAGTPFFHPLPKPVYDLQRRIKTSFDPAGIFNPGRLYPGL